MLAHRGPLPLPPGEVNWGRRFPHLSHREREGPDREAGGRVRGYGAADTRTAAYIPIAAYAALWNTGITIRPAARCPLAMAVTASGPSGIEFWIR